MLFRKKKRKQKKDQSTDESDNDEQKRKKKKKIKKGESDVESESVKSTRNLNGLENGKTQEITLVDLEEELNLEELMKQKVGLNLKKILTRIIKRKKY